MADPLVVAQIVTQAAQDVLCALAAGALACRAMLLPHPYGRAALARTRGSALGMLALALLLYLWLEAAIMSGAPLAGAGAALAPVLTQTHYGAAWSVAFAGTVIACCGGTRKGGGAMALAALGLLAYAAGKAATSHAADSGDFTLREGVHVVHLGATALWAGSVIVAAPLLRRWPRIDAETDLARLRFCARLSELATAALAIVVVTGIYNTLQDTAHLNGPLLGVPYGKLLTLKLAFVALAVLLGGYNRMVCLPHLRAAVAAGDDAQPAQRRFNQLLAIEAVAMLAVLTIAGVLGHTSPTGS